MVTLPSLSEMALRLAPVALLVTDTLAPGTTAPVESTTLTISVAVLGDCARTGIAISPRMRNVQSNIRDRIEISIGLLLLMFGGRSRRGEDLDVPAPADQKE